jgi:hypothetical protein
MSLKTNLEAFDVSLPPAGWSVSRDEKTAIEFVRTDDGAESTMLVVENPVFARGNIHGQLYYKVEGRATNDDRATFEYPVGEDGYREMAKWMKMQFSRF